MSADISAQKAAVTLMHREVQSLEHAAKRLAVLRSTALTVSAIGSLAGALLGPIAFVAAAAVAAASVIGAKELLSAKEKKLLEEIDQLEKRGELTEPGGKELKKQLQQLSVSGPSGS